MGEWYDYLVPGLVMTLCGIALSRIRRGNGRPGDLLLKALPQAAQDWFWRGTRILDFGLIGLGQVYRWYGVWLFAASRLGSR